MNFFCETPAARALEEEMQSEMDRVDRCLAVARFGEDRNSMLWKQEIRERYAARLTAEHAAFERDMEALVATPDAEGLDEHRKAAQAQGVGTTALYDVAAKAAARQSLTPAEQRIYDSADVPKLLALHAAIDAAAAEAYGWPWPMSDEEILRRVVALNAERHAAEQRGHIRWLRPEYQIPLHNQGGQSRPSAKEPNGKMSTMRRG